MRSGEKVAKLTKKVGQTAPTGRIVRVVGESAEVRWDDGHTSLISKSGLVPAKRR